jgi:hypothetical protein
MLALKLSYNCIKQVKQQEMSIKYALNNTSTSEVIVSYNPDVFNVLTANKQKSQTPTKNQGFFI